MKEFMEKPIGFYPRLLHYGQYSPFAWLQVTPLRTIFSFRMTWWGVFTWIKDSKNCALKLILLKLLKVFVGILWRLLCDTSTSQTILSILLWSASLPLFSRFWSTDTLQAFSRALEVWGKGALSPYLFCIVMECFSAQLSLLEKSGMIPFPYIIGELRISIFFLQMTFWLFARATYECANSLNQMLSGFSNQPGLTTNSQKKRVWFFSLAPRRRPKRISAKF